MSQSLILFDQEFYKQHDRVVMGSPLGNTLANVFLLLSWNNLASKFSVWVLTFLLIRSKHDITNFEID